MTVFVAFLLLASAPCPDGRVDVGSNKCCWPGQFWDQPSASCIGTPKCPTGLLRDGATCVATGCPAGQVSDEDTQGHCCWPKQVWSKKRKVCVGIPSCPASLRVQDERCVATTDATTSTPTAQRPP